MARPPELDAPDTPGSDSQAADPMASEDLARGGGPPPSKSDAAQAPDQSSGLDTSEGEGTSEGQDASEDAVAESHPVGPGHPPRNTRWKKGGPSPNPRGRPRKDQTMRSDVKKLLEQALNRKVPVTSGDRQVLMTRLELGFEQLLNQFAKGDRYALRNLVGFANKLGLDLLANGGQALGEALTPNYQSILDAFLARQLGTPAPQPAAPAPAQKPTAATCEQAKPLSEQAAARPMSDPAPRTIPAPPLTPVSQGRVFAPPDLLDDDVVEDRPAEPAATPSPAGEVEPEVQLPTPVPGNEYPKPPERMTMTELRAWYPEWCARYGEAWEKQRLKKLQLANLAIRR